MTALILILLAFGVAFLGLAQFVPRASTLLHVAALVCGCVVLVLMLFIQPVPWR